MDATKLQETIDQAMKQAMINWTNSLASTTNYTVNGVDAGKIIHQFDYHTSQPIVFQHQTPVQAGGYQYYASAPQPMACQQPWLAVHQPQLVVQQPWPMFYQLQQPANYQLLMLTPSLVNYQPQQSDSYQTQASAHQPMSYRPLMAIPQQSNYYLAPTSVCHMTCQLQQLRPDSCQPIMQQSESIIHQQCIANSQDGEFESKVLVSGVSR